MYVLPKIVHAGHVFSKYMQAGLTKKSYKQTNKQTNVFTRQLKCQVTALQPSGSVSHELVPEEQQGHMQGNVRLQQASFCSNSVYLLFQSHDITHYFPPDCPLQRKPALTDNFLPESGKSCCMRPPLLSSAPQLCAQRAVKPSFFAP